MIKFGRYKVCLFDLFTDGKTGKLDSSKIWQHICYAILSKSMLSAPPTWDLIAAYGSIVGGSRVAMAFLKYKYRDGAGGSLNSKSDDQT